MSIKKTLLAVSFLALTACSSSESTSGSDSIADSTTSSTAAAVVEAETIIAALTAPLKGPISIVVTDGEERMELSETADGDRLLLTNESDITTEWRVIGETVYSAAPDTTSFAGRWYAMDSSEVGSDSEVSFTSPLRDLLEDALGNVFGYGLDECLENDPAPELVDDAWSITCTQGVDLLVTLDDAGRLANLNLGDGYVATIKYEALDVKVPTDLILDDEFNEFATEMQKFAAIATVEGMLGTLSREARALAAADGSLNATQLADAVNSDAAAFTGYGVTIGREGASRIRIDMSGPGFSCGGTLDIRSGDVTVGKVTCS